MLFFLGLAAHTSAAGLFFPLLSRWTITLPAAPAFAPAYDSAHAYIAMRDARLVALAFDSGKTVWSVECPTTAAPAAGDGLVFTGDAGFVQALAQGDGRQRWRTPINGSIASLYWDSGWLIATTDESALLAIRATDGAILWQRPLEVGLQGAPALAGNRLYVSTAGGALLALDLKSGESIWSIQLPKPGTGVLALEDRLYVGSQDDSFYCFSTKDGRVVWRWKTGADVIGVPVIDAKRIYFVSLDNVLRALDRKNGSVRWQKSLPMRPAFGPLLTGWTIIVAGSAAELHAYSSEFSGAPLGELIVRSGENREMQLAGPPHLTGEDRLILVTKGGEMQAFDTSPSPSGP